MDSLWDSLATPGAGVVVEACPGAGKTREMVRLCDERTLFLAYNNELASRVGALIRKGTCLTFHALCGACLETVFDDLQMEDAVVRAEEGTLVPHDVPDVDRVFIDEAQDVRQLYVRLVRVLGLASKTLLVCGDVNQLIYDFDPNFPATERTLRDPASSFGDRPGGWTRVTLEDSRRLTSPVATFVNRLFGTHIRGLRTSPSSPSPPVDVRLLASPSHVLSCLADVVDGPHSVLVLVDRKKNNYVLRTFLNQTCKRRKVCVHGMDDDPSPLSVGTYWSAKGLDCDTVVVFVPANVPRNALYVALTRPTRRLVLVLDAKAPNHAVVGACLREEEGVVSHPPFPGFAFSQAAHDESLRGRRAWQRSSPVRMLDAFLPSRTSELSRLFRPSPPASPPLSSVVSIPGHGTRDVAPFLVRFALVCLEWKRTGSVRRMECILTPPRVDFAKRDALYVSGLASRPVPPFASDDSLLSPDMRRIAEECYADASSDEHLAEVSLAIEAWDNYDHLMRFSRPVSAWTPLAVRGCSVLEEVLEEEEGSVEFDTRMVKGACHCSVHILARETCYHVVWRSSSTDVAHACVRAGMHPRLRCKLVELSTGGVTTIQLDSDDVLVE